MTRDEAEIAVLRLLSEQGPDTYLTRFEIGAEVWRINGGTLCASVIGSLLTRRLIRTAPSSKRRYALSDAGRLALELIDLMEAGAA